MTECPTHLGELARVKAVKCVHIANEWVVMLHYPPDEVSNPYMVLSRHGCFETFHNSGFAEVLYQRAESLMRKTGKPCCVHTPGVGS